MADPTPPDVDERPARTASSKTLRLAQLLLLVAALGLWVASRMAWVVVSSYDHLGPPRTTTLTGASWSTALVPLALFLVAAAVAGLAVRDWPLRGLALLVALGSAATAYLAITMWVTPDVAPRAIELAEIPVTSLVEAERHHVGATITLVAAVLALAAAVLMMRAGARGALTTTKYERPAARRAAAGADEVEPSERTLWDALDEGVDPTVKPADSSRAQGVERDTEGR